MKFWAVTDRPNIVISCLPKVGSTSIKGLGYALQTPSEARHATIRVGVVRNPLSRLSSLYGFLRSLQLRTDRPGLGQVPTKTYEEYIDYVLLNEDPHWNEQVGLLEGIPTVWHRLESLQSFWPLYYDVALPHKNASPSVEVNEEYRIEEVLTKYQRDLSLWQSLGDKDERKRY